MTDMMRRMVAEQLATALADALPQGSFDRANFVERMLADEMALPAITLAAALDLSAGPEPTRSSA